MKHHNVFISYRRLDGGKLAKWIYDNLNGLAVGRNDNKYCELEITDCKLDLIFPGGRNWKKHIQETLKQTNSLIIVCSPACQYENPYLDWMYFEMKWWLANVDYPPILIAKSSHGKKYIPDIIKSQYEAPQVIEILDEIIDGDKININLQGEIKVFLDAIRASINQNSPKTDSKQSPSCSGIFSWEKDRQLNYTKVSEAYAQAAGYDSPTSMIGKNDFQMPWKALANLFQEGDRQLLRGKVSEREVVLEKEIMVDRVADILVYETTLFDTKGRIIGVQGYFMDVTDKFEINSNVKYNEYGEYVIIRTGSNEFVLDIKQINVFRLMVRGFEPRFISEKLGLQLSQVKGIQKSIAKQLQCKVEDIVVTAVRTGLPIRLFGI